jgi:histidine triad (HIT) family protein
MYLVDGGIVENCIFCKIVKGESPSETLFQDEQVTAFRDIHPVAPTHVIIVPNKHYNSISEIEKKDEQVVGHLFYVANQIAKKEGIAKKGYRLIINHGKHGGQVIFHLHLHLIGGHRMQYPIG